MAKVGKVSERGWLVFLIYSPPAEPPSKTANPNQFTQAFCISHSYEKHKATKQA